MTAQYHTKKGRTSKRGAFMNGIWHCECEPRMPAEKFQTKNGGKNHGRWFFTCQKPQPRRCSFFLWSDDAKVREEAAVLNNSRSEPNLPAAPQTPKKPAPVVQPPTPISAPRLDPSPTMRQTSGTAHQKTSTQQDDNESFEWSSSGDEDLVAIAEAASHGTESPSKAAQTCLFNSPSKRRHSGILSSTNDKDSTYPNEEAFRTPSTSTLSLSIPSPRSVHLHETRQPPPPPPHHSTLTSEVLAILIPVALPATIETELISLLSRHELRTQGIKRGRDITRVAVQTKETKIAELQARISALEADRETTRTVIAHLKQDIATSPKRPKRPYVPHQQQSNV